AIAQAEAVQADEFLKQVHVDGSHGASSCGRSCPTCGRRMAAASEETICRGVQWAVVKSGDPGWVRPIRSRVGQIHPIQAWSLCPIHNIRKKVDELLEHPDGVDTELLDSLGLCERALSLFAEECADLDAKIKSRIADVDVVHRLRTIPGIVDLVSANIYATIGDISRFPNAHMLASYVGLVPTVSQSGGPAQLGHITKEGSSELRAVMIQAAHIAA